MNILKNLFKAKPTLLPTTSSGGSAAAQEEEEEEELQQTPAERSIPIVNNREEGCSVEMDEEGGVTNLSGGGGGGGGVVEERIEEKGVQENVLIENVLIEERVQENVFQVGDFVWGKAKNQRWWWPGQIYSPLDASSFALKYQEEENDDRRLLVAYFGDIQCYTWCHPSELKPFQENFENMVTQTKAKKFRNAVDELLNEIGRNVEANMSCSCIRMEARIPLVKPLAVNPGIKGGVVVPDCPMEEFSITHFEPAKFVSVLKYIAEMVDSPTTLLQLAVFRRQLAAFKSRQSDGKTGDPEEDWLASPTIRGIKENWPEISRDTSHQKKKQRTMVDIMANDMDVDGETDTAEEEDTGGKSVSTSRKRKENDGDFGSGNLGSEMTEKKATNDGEGSAAKHMPRERKKSKYLSPPYTNLGKGSKQWFHSEDSVTETPKASKESRIGGKMKKAIDQLFGSSPKASPEVSFNPMTSEQKKIVLEQKSDEMFYEFVTAALDPMYLKENPSSSLIKGFFTIYRSSLYHEGSNSRMFISGMAEQCDVSSLYHEGSNSRMFISGMAEQCDVNGSQLESDHQTPKDLEPKTLQTKDEIMSQFPNNDLKEVNLKDDKSLQSPDSAAKNIKRKYEKKQQIPNSENLQSPNGEPVRIKRKYEKKLKSPKSEVNTVDDKMLQSPNGEPQRVKRKYVKKLKSPNGESNHIAGTPNLQPNPGKEANGQTSGAALFLKFASGVALPTKGDLVKEFEKFGALNESKTEVLQDSRSAQVIYTSSSDAEAAFSSSGKITTFGPPNMVSYRLQYPLTTFEGSSLNETISGQHLQTMKQTNHQATPANQAKPVTPVQDPLEFLKQSLLMMTTTLEKSGDTLSPDLKAKLECEIKNLMQKVTKGESSSSQ